MGSSKHGDGVMGRWGNRAMGLGWRTGQDLCFGKYGGAYGGSSWVFVAEMGAQEELKGPKGLGARGGGKENGCL